MSGGSSLALALSVTLIGWAAAMRALAGTWLQPSAFFALWWCCAGIVPLLLAPRELVGPNAIGVLVASSVAFSMGGAVGNWGLRTRRIANPTLPGELELTILRWLCAMAVALGIGSTIAFVRGSGIAFAQLLDLEQLVVVSNQFYIARYAETGPLPAPPLSQALLPFVYLAPGLGGLLFGLERGRLGKLIGLASYSPAIAVTVLQTTKAAVLLGIVLWLSSYFAARLRIGKIAVFTKGHLLTGLSVGAGLAIFFLGVGLARLASTDTGLANVVIGKLVTSALGHMAVLSQWLGDYWNQPFEPTLGTVTFAGPRELLGLQQRIPGLFEDIVDLVAGESSNVHTAFRPLIQDFTMPGALAILAILGAVGGFGFRLVAAGRWIALPLLIIAYVTIFWMPITLFWIYNSLTVAVAALGLIVFFIEFVRRSVRAG